MQFEKEKIPEETAGSRILQLCKEKNLSQRELARRSGITASQISRILKGETKTISSDILMALAKELDVSADYILGIKQEQKQEKQHIFMLLMSSSFPLGGCRDFIESLSDLDEKNMAYAEYYYFSGQHEKSVEYTELYLEHEDIVLKLSACLLYTFANLSLDRIYLARLGLQKLKEHLEAVMRENADRKTIAYCVFATSTAYTLFHLPMADIPPLSEYISELEKGKQLWGSYVLAHRAYLSKEYERVMGIVETCLITEREIYPIPMIYLNLAAAMAAMNLRKKELAKKYFMDAWKISKQDDLIEGIGEHHGLLQGLIESCMKKDYPEDYERIINITYRFSCGWRHIHNPNTNEDVADNLTTTEFTVAMLANRGWSNQEIADHLEITQRTVKQHLTCIYNKLNISTRKQLKDYMLQ